MESNLFPASSKLHIFVLGILLALVSSGGYVFAQEGYSHVRIVRLSFTQGTVTIERPGSSDWEAAPTNTPIQEGFKLATAAHSYAEVQFENSSTARLGEQSELDFNELALSARGDKLNRMELAAGYATFNVLPENGDVYEVTAGRSTLTPSGSAQFRVDLDQTAERVEVFKGEVSVSSPYGSADLAKNDVLRIQPGLDDAFAVTRGITPDDWDKWVESRQQVLTAQYNNQGVQGFNPYPNYSSQWGWNDLSYYGDWGYVPGYGYGWCPVVAPGWMPYTLGEWVWYPGFGWTWISAEPWGWMPFHYGYWTYVGGVGWYWFPNGLGPWSPGLVNWYQGSGWVGWYPRIAPGHGPACADGHKCIVAVNESDFRRGRMVSPGDLLKVEPSQGRAVSAPSIAPLSSSTFQRGRMTANPARNAANVITGSNAQVGSGSNVVVMGSRRPRFGATAPSVVLPASVSAAARTSRGAPAANSAGIVFDSRSGRFVNNPNRAPAVTSGAAPSAVESQSAPARTLEPGASGPATSGASPEITAPAASSSGHHFDLFGLFGHRGAPEAGTPSNVERGSSARGGSSPVGGVLRGSESAPRGESAPARASAPRSEPSIHSAPAPAPGPHFGGGGGFHGGGGSFHSDGGGGGHAGGGGGSSGGHGGRPPH